MHSPILLRWLVIFTIAGLSPLLGVDVWVLGSATRTWTDGHPLVLSRQAGVGDDRRGNYRC